MSVPHNPKPYDWDTNPFIRPGDVPLPLLATALQALYEASLGDNTYAELLTTIEVARRKAADERLYVEPWH